MKLSERMSEWLFHSRFAEVMRERAVREYGVEGVTTSPFNRCDGCHRVITDRQIREYGKCPSCGSTHCRNARLSFLEELRHLIPLLLFSD